MLRERAERVRLSVAHALVALCFFALCAALSSDSALNCCLRACSKKDLSTALTLQPSGKLLVSGGVSSVKTMADKALLPSDELLLDYGKGFWLTQRPHCAVCFVRDEEEETITNPLVMCSAAVHHGTRSACSVARHRNCFADPPTLADLAAGSGVDFYCPNHLAQLSPPAPAVHLPSTPVAPRGLGAVPLDEPPWTPPPNRAINASPPPTAAAATPFSGSSRASLSEPQWTSSFSQSRVLSCSCCCSVILLALAPGYGALGRDYLFG